MAVGSSASVAYELETRLFRVGFGTDLPVVAATSTDGPGSAIVSAVVALARTLGLGVIAGAECPGCAEHQHQSNDSGSHPGFS